MRCLRADQRRVRRGGRRCARPAECLGPGGWRAHQTPAEVGSRFGRPYRPPLRENRERVCRGGFYIRPCAPTCRMHQRRPHPVGARMARPSPVPATTGARDISNLVSGGYKIRPYGVDGGVRGRRSASDPGGGGPIKPRRKSGAGSGGHTGRPYGKTESGSVGADFISARAHRRVECTNADRTP